MHIRRVLTAPVTVPGTGAGQVGIHALSVGLLLDDGRLAWGDCVGVEPVPGYDEALAVVRRVVAPALEGRELVGFRQLAAEMDALTAVVTETRPRRPDGGQGDAGHGAGGQEGFSRRALLTAPARLFQAQEGAEEPPAEQVAVERRLHPAIRYGLGQALLGAVAQARGVTMAQVVADEWGLARPETPVPIHAPCGRERQHAVDRMILHGVASLADAPVDDVAEQVGASGDRLTRSLRRLVERIGALGGEQYHPAIHLDLRGALGQIADHHPGHMLGHLYAWRMAAGSYPLRIEDPVLLGDRRAQIEGMGALHGHLRLRKMDVQLVAAAWIESLDDLAAFLAARPAGDGPPVDMIHLRMARFGGLHDVVEGVLACRRVGIKVLLGGSARETEVAARAAVHVALAARPDLILARPGEDVDVAVSLVRNEMARTLVAIAARQEPAAPHPGHGGIEI